MVDKNTVPELVNDGSKIINEQASLYEHEQVAIDKIAQHIKDDFFMIKNAMIWDEQTNYYYEYDLVIIGRSGIYVTELKHWTGEIEIKEYQWRIDKTRYRADPHKSNNLKCKILKGLYQHRFATYPDVWVESVVVLTNPEAVIYNADPPDISAMEKHHNFTFSSIEDLISFLRRREKNTPILNNAQTKAIAKFIANLNKPKQKIQYAVPGYETVEYLSQRPECIELLAKPIGIKGKSLFRLRVFRFIQKSQRERERLRKSALNTLNAVQQINDKSYIHNVSIMQLDTGDIVEISEWSDTGTLRDLILDCKQGWPLDKALGVLNGIAKALQQTHKHLIIHRAVKPENILIINNVPKLTNFDLAFQPEDERLTVIPDITRVQDDGYVAPELLSGDDIDETTDYFSLGVIAFQLLTGQKPFKNTRQFIANGGELTAQNLEQLRVVKIPETLIKALDELLVGNRMKRDKGMREFLLAISQDKPKMGKLRNARLEPGKVFDMKEIIEFIAEGRESQIYKARSFKGKIVALKVFNYETPRERIFNEIELGSEVNSPLLCIMLQPPGIGTMKGTLPQWIIFPETPCAK